MVKDKSTDWYSQDVNDLLDYFYNEIKENKKLVFLTDLLENFPDLDIEWAEMLEDTPEYNSNDYPEILQFAVNLESKLPDYYYNNYEFIEKSLTDFAFLSNNRELIHSRLNVIQKNAVAGIDTVVVKTLFQLIFYGYYEEAKSYSESIWKPLSESEKLWGYPEYPFINVIYLYKLEEQYHLLKKGIGNRWENFLVEISDLGFDNEEDRIDCIKGALIIPLDKDSLLSRLTNKHQFSLLSLNIYFLRYMKDKYSIPFLLSDKWFSFMFNEKIAGKAKDIDAFFYIHFNDLDRYVAEKLDTLLGSNQIEVFGSVWGMNYVYEFLYENRLITHHYFNLMIENIFYLKREFLKVIANELWQMGFIFHWPESKYNSMLSLNKNFFNKMKRIEFSEAIELINRNIPHLPGEDRIDNEQMKTKRNAPINKSDEIIHPLGDKPYIKSRVEVGRNDPCPCGSGKKYKKCCLIQVK